MPLSPGNAFFKLCEEWKSTELELEAWVLQQKGVHAEQLKSTRRLLAKKQVDRKRSLKGMEAKERKKERVATCRTRKGNLYEHCRLLNNKGEILANCNKKKIQWYLDRGLGTIVKEEPLTLKLNFVANGPGHKGNKFYLEKKQNVCVGCGTKKDIVRYHVVPLYYRKYFPEFLRSHCSHDIVLLCIKCRARVNENVMFKKIAEETGVPHDIPKFVDLPEVAHAKKAASALLRPEILERIPLDRQKKLRETCAKYLKKSCDEVTPKDLRRILDRNIREAVSAYVPPGKQIVDNMSLEEVRRLIYRWRQFFLDTVKPQHLSKYWSVYAER